MDIRGLNSMENTIPGTKESIDDITEWYPARFLKKERTVQDTAYALVILNQPIQNLYVLETVWNKGIKKYSLDIVVYTDKISCVSYCC
jgi:hypothetical protein